MPSNCVSRPTNLALKEAAYVHGLSAFPRSDRKKKKPPHQGSTATAVRTASYIEWSVHHFADLRLSWKFNADDEPVFG